MLLMKRIALLLFPTLLLLSAPPAVRTGVDQERLAKIPVRMKQFIERGEAAGTVNLVARNGQIVLLEAAGWQDAEARKPMRTDSIFQIMSMTKPFTGLGIMMLMEDGKISLNDPVERYLPEFKGQMVAEKTADGTRPPRKPARPITVRDPMTHTSGMSGPHAPLKDLYQRMNITLTEAVPVFAKAPLEFEPGSKWQYSNTGIATLGRLIEVLSDQPYEQFITEKLLKPLAMKDSFFFPPPDKTERIAAVYARKDDKLVKTGGETLGGDAMQFRKGARYSAPEFGLYSTAPDLFAFYQMMLNGGTYNGKRFLTKASVDLMSALHTGNLQAGHNPGTGFGLTWEVVKDPMGTLTLWSPGTFGHGGAFGTHGWIDRQKNLVGVFMVQRSGGATDIKNVVFQMTAASMLD
jgi:CubicO group peptidase (beta-lactamase class C family)